MTPEQFKRVSEIFLLARKCAADKLAALMDRECGSDCVVREEVERMLRFDSDDSIDSAQIRLGGHLARDLPPFDPFPPGAQIGEFTVTRTLGEGGMGRVLEVQQEHPRRRVALKLLRQESLSRTMLQRFDHEIRILGEMQHEGIARIHAAGWTDGQPPQPYFTMELIDGEPLTTYATKHRLGTRQRLNLVASVCDAVQYAHQRGVVHRDLKPANILVGADDKPKVVDFGIARIGDAESATNTLRTATGQIIGTLPYMSPEQVSGNPANVDSRTDVYALGVVLYELLSGRLPHDLKKRSIAESARLVQESGISRLGTIDRALRGDIETIVAKALQKEPDRRYASASELALDIRRYLSNQPIVARPSSAVYQIRKFASRHRAAAVATIAIGVTLVGATIFSATFAVNADRERRIAEQARGKEQTAREAANQARIDAERQSDIAAAVIEFLNDDLLASVAPSPSQDEGSGRDVKMSVVLAEAATRIDAACAPGGAFENKPEVESAIRLTLGDTLMRLGDAGAAFPHLRRCYDLRRSTLGDGAEKTLEAVVSLGGALYQQAKLDEAIALYEQSLKHGRLELGPDHSLVLECEIRYANVHWRLRQFEPALALFNHIYEARLATLGPDDPQTDTPLVSIALVYSQQGRNKEAEKIMRPALARYSARLGEDHPATLRVANNLGLISLRLERFEEAADILETVLEHRRRVLGADHYETLSTCINLGSVLIGLNRAAEAESVFQEGFDASLARYGPDHVRTLSLELGLANALREQRRYEDAEPHYLEALRRRESTVGPGDRQTMLVNIGLFEMRMMQDRKREAEKVLSRPVAALQEAGKLANDSGCVELLIACRLDLGMHDEALDLAQAYAASIRANEGEDSPNAIRGGELIQQTEHRIAFKLESQGASN